MQRTSNVCMESGMQMLIDSDLSFVSYHRQECQDWHFTVLKWRAKCAHLSLPLPHECGRGRDEGAAPARSAAGGGGIAQDERQADHCLAEAHLVREHTPAQLLWRCWRLPLHCTCACTSLLSLISELCDS